MSYTVDFVESKGAGAGFVSKNAFAAFAFNGTTFVKITSSNYPSETVRGIVYLDGTYYVMTPDARIYGSEINDPSGWSALNVIQALSEPDGAVCLARQGNLLVAFGDYSTEFFYNAANPTGSPLLPYSNSFLQIGCASAGSVISVDDSLVLMTNTKQRGRSIQKMTGTKLEPISNPHVDRILDKDSLYGCRAYHIKLEGHLYYLLVLPDTNVTLVCDLVSGQWNTWTELKEVGTVSVTSTWENGLTTCESALHPLSSGDVIKVGEEYFPVNKIDQDSFQFYSKVSNLPTSVVRYRDEYFDITGYAKGANTDLVMDSSTGFIYALTSDAYLDGDVPIKFSSRTPLVDGGHNKMKFFSSLSLLGDRVDSKVYVAHTDNDYQTWSKYRPINMNESRPLLSRLGSARRRGFHLVHIGNTALRLKHIELDLQEGTT